MFGQQPAFGTPTTQASGFGGFGTSTFGTSSGGLFGQPQQPAQQQSLFGTTNTFGTSTFGQPQQPQSQPTSNPFGQTTTTFGASNPFSSQPQPAQTGGLFGTTTSFGGPATQPAAQTTFGQPQQQQTTGLFGSTTTGSSLFGQSKPGGFGTTSTFGAQPATNSLFGTQQAAQPTTGLFGSTTTGTGLFGQQPNANPFGASGQNPVGTTIKFSPMLGQDTAVKNGNQSTVTTKNFCICTMKEYEEKKSLEELRYEDYQAGRKFGTAAAPAQPGSLFGQPAAQPSTGGLFGSTTSAFGQATTFGQAAAKPSGFGTTGSLFGSTAAQPASTGLFGQSTTPSVGGFGATAGTTSLFGSQQPQSTTTSTGFGTAFGTNTGFGTATQQTQPLFGSMTTGTAAAPSAFGAASTFGPNTGFGQPSAFGANTAPSTGLFGSQPATTATSSAFPAFGQSSLFSKPATTSAPAFGGFGNTPTPATTGFSGFGSLGNTAAGTSGSLFGNNTSVFGASNATKPAFGGFGQTTTTPATTSFFGSQPAASTQSTGSLFGQAGTTSGSIFGQQTGSSLFATNSFQQPTSNQSSSGSVHAQIVELVRSGVSDTDVLCNMYSQLPMKEAEKKTQPLSRDTINAFISNAKKNYAPPAGESRKDERLYSFYVAPTHSFDGLNLSSTSGHVSWRSAAAKRDEKLKLDRAYIEKVESEVSGARSDAASRASTSTVSQIQSSVYSTASKNKAISRTDRAAANAEKVTPPVQVSRNLREAFDEDSPQGTDERQSSFVGRGREKDVQLVEDDDSDRENVPTDVGFAVVLTKPGGYYTIPDAFDLVLDEKCQCVVDGFLVGRYGCGSVKFLGSTNVAKLNLDKLVTINDKEVVVYPDDNDKPPIGKGLNKKAVVTFENVWPMSSDMETVVSKQEIIDSGFEDVLRARIAAMDDAEFLHYNMDLGMLSFSVRHFSRYKLVLTADDTRSLVAKRKMPLERSFGNVVDGNSNAEQPHWMKGTTMMDEDVISAGKRRRSEKNDWTDFKENNVKPRSSYANVSRDVEDYFERALLDSVEGEEPPKVLDDIVIPRSIKRYRGITTDFGPGFKPACAQLVDYYTGEQCVVVDGEGELSIIQHIDCEREELTADSKWLLEEMVEFYLSNCSYKVENGQTRVYAPDRDEDFVARFCDFAGRLTEGKPQFLSEKLAWDLFKNLYKSFQSAETNNCEGFYEWLMSAVSLLTPRLPLDSIPEACAAREIFLHMMCGDSDKALLIARHFGLFSIENAIIIFLSSSADEFNGEADDDNETPQDAVRSLLRDYVQAMMDSTEEVHQDDIYMCKLLMLLSGVTKMSAEHDVGQGRMISICEDLNWLQCFAVSAFNLRLTGRPPADIMSIVQHYKDLAEEDPYFSLPSEDSPVPLSLYSMIQHYGRLSSRNMESTLEKDIMASSEFDIRVKWFMMRLYRMLQEGFSDSTELLLTSDFANTLQTCNFPHIAITVLMHLPQTRSCMNRIKELSLALSTMRDRVPEVYKSLSNFLSEDVNLSEDILKETEASLALKSGNYLEAMDQYYLAGNFVLCKDLIRTHVLPIIASGNRKVQKKALDRVKNISGDVEGVAPYGKFFELLRVTEDIQQSEFVSEHAATLLTDILEYLQDNWETLLVGFSENSVVREMVKDRLKEGQALLYYHQTSEFSVPNFSP